jgi:uncharacterized protein (DUF362 family)
LCPEPKHPRYVLKYFYKVLKVPVVSIKQIQENILPALESLLKPIAPGISISGKSVLIKPNLVEPVPFTTGQTTNPALVEAIVVWCKKRGAKKIAIGEGPSYFLPKSALRECFTRTGIAEVAERQGIPWILFDDEPFREFRNHSPGTPNVFSVSEHAFTWDSIINVPVPKTHYLTVVSIAMKNLKGFIKREDKPSFHHCGQEGIHGSVTELNIMIRPSLNIVDCTAPTQQNKNFILASTDIVATDAVTTSLMGINPQKIRTIQLGFKEGLGEKEISRIDITGDELKDFKMNFEQTEHYLKRVFPKLNFKANTACSGCLIPLFSSLRRMEEEGIKPVHEAVLVLGKEVPESKAEKTILIGQCTEAYKNGNSWFGGCPPTKEQMFEFLRDNL